MFIYVGKHFNAESAGATIVGVECEKCRCRYYYHLARIGSGTGAAPYGIGAGAAASAAQAGSERDLQARLASEAELVPCPRCGWISSELVGGYRRTRFRFLTSLAVGIGFFGVIICLIAAWYLGGTFDGERVRPYVLYGGPAFFIALSIGIFLLQWCLRQLIRPNWRFPRAPDLPPGTPPALLLDEESGELQFAPARQISEDDWFDFQLGRHAFPPICCDCLRPTKETAAVPIWWSNTPLAIPHCSSCAAAKGGHGHNGAILAVIGLVVAAMGAVTYFVSDSCYLSGSLCSLVALLFVVVPIMAKRLPPRGPAHLVSSDSARGVVRLRFRNPKYADVVAQYVSGTTTGPPATDRVVKAAQPFQAPLSVGASIVTVDCDRCGCEYYYELARVGGVGTSSQEESDGQLKERFASEAELVPCPQCHWISDLLIRGYAQTKYPRWDALVVGTFLAGVLMLLLCGCPGAFRGSPNTRSGT